MHALPMSLELQAGNLAHSNLIGMQNQLYTFLATHFWGGSMAHIHFKLTQAAPPQDHSAPPWNHLGDQGSGVLTLDSAVSICNF